VARTDPSLIVWWGTAIKCASALPGLEPEDALDNRGTRGAFGRLAQLTATWLEVDSGDLDDRLARAAQREGFIVIGSDTDLT
jgi:hypothetical protein